VALAIFVAAILLLSIRSLVAGLLVLLVVAAALALLSATMGNIWRYPLYLMPVLINTTLGVLFGRTLLPGRTPLITGISIRLHGKLEVGVADYTRHVTQIWTAFFTLLLIESLTLALVAPLEIWSLFTNILNYLFAGLLFVGEYFYRVRHLDHLEHPDFVRFLRSLSRVSPGVFTRQ